MGLLLKPSGTEMSIRGLLPAEMQAVGIPDGLLAPEAAKADLGLLGI